MAKSKNGFPILGANDKLNFGGGKKPYKRDEKVETGDFVGKTKSLDGVAIHPSRPSQSGRKFAGGVIRKTVLGIDVSQEKISKNSNYGVYAEYHKPDMALHINTTCTYANALPLKQDKFEVSLIQKIRAKKDLKDLFKPLNRVKVKIFTDALINTFPETIAIGEKFKPGQNALQGLKMISYLGEDKTENRKFLPKDKDQDIIMAGSLCYDFHKKTNLTIDSFLSKLETNILKLYRKDSQFISFVDEVLSLIRKIEFQDLDANILDEFQHYEPAFKWLRSLKEPRLENVIDSILMVIAEKKIAQPMKKDQSFEQGTLLLNLVKKLGLRYITTRSNLEWAMYGPQLKRIRNFMSKKTYFVYLTTLRDRILADAAGFNNDSEHESFKTNKNINILFSTLEKMIEQKQKRHVHQIAPDASKLR